MSVPKYAISNVAYGGYANLLGGKPNGVVGAYSVLDANSEWYSNPVGSLQGRFTFTSAGPEAEGVYISFDEATLDTELHGYPKETNWTVFRTSDPTQFQIVPSVNKDLYWTLDGPGDNIPIRLEPGVKRSLANTAQLWTFHHLGEGEDVMSALNDLD